MGLGGAQRRVNRRGRGVKIEVTEVKKICRFLYFVELLLQFRLDRAVIARGCSGKVQLNPLETEF